jgi:hypothetical protein
MKHNIPEFSLDYEQDTYRQIFHCKTTTLTVIKREVQAPDISVTFLELSFFTTLESFIQAQEFIFLSYEDHCLGQACTADIPADFYEPIFRVEPEPEDRQALIDWDDGFSIIWTKRGTENGSRITMRYLSQYSIAQRIHRKWLWKFENLQPSHLHACARTLRARRHLSVENTIAPTYVQPNIETDF